MFTSIKVYLKFLGRNRVYTAINFVGFSAALVFVILLGLYVVDESGTDRFHEKSDRTFRMTQSDGGSASFYWPALVPGDLAARYPEIESFTRFRGEEMTVGTQGEEKVRAKAIVVDRAFFDIFSFPMAEGDPTRQLLTSGDVTLSESFALRLFGGEDPMGQPLKIDGDPHTVTGVVRDFEDSHLANPDIIVSFDDKHLHPLYFGNDYGYRVWNFPVYFLQRENSSLADREGDMTAFMLEEEMLFDENRAVRFEPVARSYFNSENAYNPAYRSNTHQFILLLGVAALAVLLFAVINYVNLSVAVGGFRAREAATRQLLGATRRGLLANHIFESVLFCCAALVVATIFAAGCEDLFNGVMGSRVSVADALLDPAVVALLVGAALVLGVISGVSPALVITRVKPIDIVKGEFTRRTRMVYSRLFIGLQFCLTIVLIGSAVTIVRQTQFMRTTDLGFDKEHLIYLENVNDDALPGLRDRLMQVPRVEMVSMAGGTPLDGGNNNTVRGDDGVDIAFQIFTGDSLYLSILGLELVRETGFGTDSAGVTTYINETAVRTQGLADDADTFNFSSEKPFAGVLRDFNVGRLQRQIPNVMVQIYSDTGPDSSFTPWGILVKTSAGNPAATYKAVQEAYLDYNGGEPFESGFIDEGIDRWYDAQQRTGTMIGGFAALAVVISAMGLVAMTTYFMRQRRRDIAVRKVFGATDSQVLERLIGSFMRIVAVAFVLAVPVIWWLMEGWLSSFAYRIPLGWSVFAVAGLSVGAVAFIAVFWQSLAAARSNPVKSLKSE
ncbi:MAG: FtsX-like permease family protein [Alistipes sp.]|jgi:putative ABC transport system permease protein|nr:FtsX-like permease family protein [Alistipes sp.]